jgi:transcription elongation factor GreA
MPKQVSNNAHSNHSEEPHDTDVILTPEGFELVTKELEHLKVVRRKEVAERIRDAKQFGEFAENAEYEEAKTEQGAVEGRIIELQQILHYATVLDEASIRDDEVSVGSVVRVRDSQSGEEAKYRIVGAVEADPEQNKISNESPVGHALLGHKVGDVCSAVTPSGTSVSYEILRISRK